MKKSLIGLIGAVAVLLGLASYAGFSPAYLLSAPGVATGIGSKLLCSARYVSGFSEHQSFDDLVQYSGILQELTVEFDSNEKTVTTSLFGLSEKTANYLPNIGCAIDYSGYSQRTSILTQAPQLSDAPWPLGDTVGVADGRMEKLLQRLLSADNELGLNTRALLVAHRGSVIAEAYGQGADATTPLLGWSMAKSLTSIMLANLEYRGLLDLSGAPGFAQWQLDQRSQIRISDMLTMTDGLAFSEEYNPGDDATAMLFTEPSSSDFVMQKAMLHEPGTHFNYSSGTANLLSRIYFERAGGYQENYDGYMESIHRPLAFQNAIFEVDASGVYMGSSYLFASARDWARIGQLMLNGGVINAQRIMSEDWVVRATTANTSANQKAYGYQWWLNSGNEDLRWPDISEDAYSAQGNRHQYLMVIPSLDLLIVRLGWTAGGYPVNERFSEIISNL
ncbi:MAG: serine hydrolase [Gammaproteobacteria bacterium]|jgi:CubicO group peptidase (beta-lactamase class C family)|nr:serine hydrolase [Gammaproteobacteria bacterium]